MKNNHSFILLNVVFLALGFISFFLHINFFDSHNLDFQKVLKGTYIFSWAFSFLLSTSLFVLNLKNILKFQIGFLYLFSVFLKLGLYFFMFGNLLELEIFTSFIMKINLLIPLFLALIFEVIILSKILNNTHQ